MTSGRSASASDRFVRISRPAIVNIKSVKELHPQLPGTTRQPGVMTWQLALIFWNFSEIPPLTRRYSPLYSRNVSLACFA